MKKTTAAKKFFMKHVWRFQQSQAFVSMLFWSLALAGIFYERSGYYFEKYLGLSADDNEQVGTKMVILMALVLVMVIIFGFMYDTILRLWEQQNIVNMERNVFAQYKMNVRELMVQKNLYIPMMKAVNDGSIDEELAYMIRWTDKILADDAIARMYYKHVNDWVMSDEVHWVPPSYDVLMKAQKEQMRSKGIEE